MHYDSVKVQHCTLCTWTNKGRNTNLNAAYLVTAALVATGRTAEGWLISWTTSVKWFRWWFLAQLLHQCRILKKTKRRYTTSTMTKDINTRSIGSFSEIRLERSKLQHIERKISLQHLHNTTISNKTVRL